MKDLNLKFSLILYLSLILFSIRPLSTAAQTSATLPDLLDSIEARMAADHIPGLLLTIVTRDSVLYADGLGMAKLKEE